MLCTVCTTDRYNNFYNIKEYQVIWLCGMIYFTYITYIYKYAMMSWCYIYGCRYLK